MIDNLMIAKKIIKNKGINKLNQKRKKNANDIITINKKIIMQRKEIIIIMIMSDYKKNVLLIIRNVLNKNLS